MLKPKKTTLWALSFSLLFFIAMIPMMQNVKAAPRAPPNRYCTITSPSNGLEVSGVVDIVIDASSTAKLFIDGNRIGDTNYYSWDTTSYADGLVSILAKVPGAEDVISVTVNNGGTPPANEAPVVSIINPTNGATVANAITIEVSVSDDVDTLIPDIFIDGNYVTTALSYSWDTTTVSDGTHTIYAEATDSGSLTDSESITVTVENTVTPPPNEAPVVIINAPTNGATVANTITIEVSVSDDVDTLIPDIYIDGNYITTALSYSWDTTTFSDGTHTIYAEATDSGSLTDSESITVTVDNSVSSGDDYFYGTVASGSDTWHYIDAGLGEIFCELSWSNSYDVDMYLYRPSDYSNYVVRAYTTSNPETMSYNADEAGMWGIRVNMYSSNAQSDYTLHVTYTPNTPDTTAPTCSITAPTEGETVYKTKVITVSASDDRTVDHVDFFIDGSFMGTDNGSPFSYAWDTTLFADLTSYVLTATAYDSAGNTGEASAITVYIDQSQAPATDPVKYAVIVGVSDYKAISDLSYCDEDATDWYNFLTGSLGFLDENIVVLGDSKSSNFPSYDGLATEANIKTALNNMISMADDDDSIVYITSGHGSGDGNGNSYLCAWDCGSGESGEDGDLWDYEIAGIFANSIAANVYINIDHCYSGGIGPELMALANAQTIMCHTTCTEDGYGWDSPDHNNGLWTAYFLEISWINHYNSDPLLDVETVFVYAHDNYPKSGGDEPQEFDGNPTTPMILY